MSLYNERMEKAIGSIEKVLTEMDLKIYHQESKSAAMEWVCFEHCPMKCDSHTYIIFFQLVAEGIEIWR